VTATRMFHLPDSEVIRRVEDTALSSDRIFFEQHPGRKFRVRPAFDVEIEDFARHGAIERTLPEKLCWWVAVHQIRSGIRMRFPLAAPHHFPTEVSEATARNVWAERCPPEWERKIRDIKHSLATVVP
jgi:hypothetical protein